MFLENMFIGALARLHALAWNTYFSTPFERYLWRFSCVGMFVFPIPEVAVAAVRDYHMDIAKIFWRNYTVARYNRWQWVVHVILCIHSLAEVNSRVGISDKTKKMRLICHYITSFLLWRYCFWAAIYSVSFISFGSRTLACAIPRRRRLSLQSGRTIGRSWDRGCHSFVFYLLGRFHSFYFSFYPLYLLYRLVFINCVSFGVAESL